MPENSILNFLCGPLRPSASSVFFTPGKTLFASNFAGLCKNLLFCCLFALHSLSAAEPEPTNLTTAWHCPMIGTAVCLTVRFDQPGAAVFHVGTKDFYKRLVQTTFVASQAGFVKRWILVPPHGSSNYLSVPSIQVFRSNLSETPISSHIGSRDNSIVIVQASNNDRDMFDALSRTKQGAVSTISRVELDSDSFLRPFTITNLLNLNSYGSSGSPVGSLPPSDLPDSWHLYPAWLRLILSADADRALSSSQRSAIATWSAFGGYLLVFSDEQAKRWQALGARPIVVSAKNLQSGISQTLTNSAGQSMARSSSPTVSNKSHPLLPETTPPRALFAIIAVLYFAAAGPFLWWFVHRRRRPVLILFLLPSMGLGVAGLMLVADSVGHGFTPIRQRFELTVLNQTTHQALNLQDTDRFCVLSDGSIELAPDSHLYVESIVRDDSRHWRGSQKDWILNLGRTAQHSVPILEARRLQQALSVQVLDKRQRIRVEATPDGPLLLNELGVGITAFRYVDELKRKWTLAAPMPGSGTSKLIPWEQGPKKAETFTLPDGRFDALGRQSWEHAGSQSGGWQAVLGAPLETSPFPGRDGAPPKAFACGLLPTGAPL